ncbi:MAG: SGNH/GDSL hydrolase family protein, partial [Chitinophagaceae bacterium]
YTIGEQVPLHESFPYQAVQLLREKRIEINAPEIIARTGWTTEELSEQISKTILLPFYNIVTLLIGVNNQYRGRNHDEYKTAFENLLQQAIAFAGGNSTKVIVLSIPDWGVTPFAKDRDIKSIAREIDQYNEQCKQVTGLLQCHFMDITTSQRADGMKVEFLAADGLHPNGREYAKWAATLADKIETLLV